ncbi:MAG: YqgE/AlgH family protein [Thermoguttaceae bacterium]
MASPDSRDPEFVRAVILLIQHSQQQAIGVILNRPSTRSLAEMWSGKRRADGQQCVYSGGPVPGPLMAVHVCAELAELEILPGLYYTVQKKRLEKLVQQSGSTFRVFESHAGWGPGQLEQFVQAGAWLVLPATRDLVFGGETELWQQLAGVSPR